MDDGHTNTNGVISLFLRSKWFTVVSLHYLIGGTVDYFQCPDGRRFATSIPITKPTTTTTTTTTTVTSST